jgi:hypothetical protein
VATATQLTRSELNDTFEALRREIVTGDEATLVTYVTDLAATAANAHRTSGTFRRWSHRNHLLLESQRRRFKESHKGLYAGVAQWAKLDRSVRSSAKAKLIWAAHGHRSDNGKAQAPIVTTEEAADAVKAVQAGMADTKTKAKPASRGSFGFKLVQVYDWSDTIANDPGAIEPDWDAPVVGADRDTRDALISASPVPVEFTSLGGLTAHGVLDDAGIHVDADIPVAAQTVELARQLAHVELGSLAQFGDDLADPSASSERATRECEATLVAVLVSRMLGLDADDLTRSAAAWLRTFTDPDTGNAIEGHKKRLKLLNAKLDSAMKVANDIVAACVPTGA